MIRSADNANPSLENRLKEIDKEFQDVLNMASTTPGISFADMESAMKGKSNDHSLSNVPQSMSGYDQPAWPAFVPPSIERFASTPIPIDTPAKKFSNDAWTYDKDPMGYIPTVGHTQYEAPKLGISPPKPSSVTQSNIGPDLYRREKKQAFSSTPSFPTSKSRTTSNQVFSQPSNIWRGPLSKTTPIIPNRFQLEPASYTNHKTTAKTWNPNQSRAQPTLRSPTKTSPWISERARITSPRKVLDPWVKSKSFTSPLSHGRRDFSPNRRNLSSSNCKLSPNKNTIEDPLECKSLKPTTRHSGNINLPRTSSYCYTRSKWAMDSEMDVEKKVRELASKAYERAADLAQDVNRETAKIKELAQTDVALGVKEMELSSERFLSKYQETLDPRMKTQFVSDFRKSIDEIRQRVHTKYEGTMNQILLKAEQTNRQELETLEYEMSQIYKAKEEKIRNEVMIKKAKALTEKRESLNRKSELELKQAELRMVEENKKRLSELSNQHACDKSKALLQLKHRLQSELEKQLNVLWKENQRIQSAEMKRIRAEHAGVADNAVNKMREGHDDLIEKFREEIEKKTKIELERRKEQLVAELEEKKHELKKQLSERNLRTAEKKEREIRDQYDRLQSSLAKDLDYAKKRLEASANDRLESSRKEMEDEYKLKLHRMEEEYFASVAKRVEASKNDLKNTYERQKQDLIKRVYDEEQRKRERELTALRDKATTETRLAVEMYRSRLHQALQVDVEKFKQKLLLQKREKLDMLERDFKEKRKVWENKMLGASELDVKLSSQDLKKRLSAEREEAVEDLKLKIAAEKQAHFDKIKEEHQKAKNERLKEIKDQYLNDPDFPASERLLDVRAEFAEELDLVDRFRAFAARIKSLETELKKSRKRCRELQRTAKRGPTPCIAINPGIPTNPNPAPLTQPSTQHNFNNKHQSFTFAQKPHHSRIMPSRAPNKSRSQQSTPKLTSPINRNSPAPTLETTDDLTGYISVREEEILEEARELIEHADMATMAMNR